MFRHFFKDLGLNFTQAPALFDLDAQFFRRSAGGIQGVQVGVGDAVTVIQNRLAQGETLEGLAEIVAGPLVGDRGGAEHLLSCRAQHGFGHVQQVAVIRVSPVELHHGELRVVPCGQTFVTEVAVDLEHFLETTHHQTLQVKLRGNTQVHIDIQRIVVSNKRTRRRAAGDRLQHRRFHFHEATGFEETAHGADHRRAGLEHLTRLRVHDQIDVALAVARFLIGQAVELIRQRAQALGQQLRLDHHHVQVAFTRLMHRPTGGDDIADIPAFDVFQNVFRQPLFIHVELDLARHVLNHDERTAFAHHATGHRRLMIQRFQLGFVFLAQQVVQLNGEAVAAEIVRESALALLGRSLTAGRQLGTALGDQVIFVIERRRVLVSHRAPYFCSNAKKITNPASGWRR